MLMLMKKWQKMKVLTDCGTDVSGKDNVITYHRYVSDGTAVTRLIGLVEFD